MPQDCCKRSPKTPHDQPPPNSARPEALTLLQFLRFLFSPLPFDLARRCPATCSTTVQRAELAGLASGGRSEAHVLCSSRTVQVARVARVCCPSGGKEGEKDTGSATGG